MMQRDTMAVLVMLPQFSMRDVTYGAGVHLASCARANVNTSGV
jgi:hypothetical protein